MSSNAWWGEHWLESGKNDREEFGVKQWNLRDWLFKFGLAPKGPDNPTPESPKALHQELQRVPKELTRVTFQREIQKQPSVLRKSASSCV
jgi:hypothetical protein